MPSLIAAFLASLPLVVISGNDDPSALPQSVWLQVGVLLLWTIRLATSERRVAPSIFRAFAPSLTFLAWASISVFWATDRFAGSRVVLSWLAAGALALLIGDVVQTTGQGRRLLVALLFGAAGVSTVGLLQHLAGWSAVPQAFPPAGTMGNKNVAAEFVVATLPAAALAFLPALAPAPALLASVATGLGVCLAYVYHATCRGAWLALGAEGLLVMAVLLRRRVWSGWTRSHWIALGAATLAFSVLANARPWDTTASEERPGQLVLGTSRPIVRFLEETGASSPEGGQSTEIRADRSVSLRLRIWRNTLSMLRAAPLGGVGIGNFAVHYPRFARSAGQDGTRIDERVDSPHNDYIQLASELGLPGTVLMAWVILSLGWSLASGWRLEGEAGRDVAQVGGLILIALLVTASVSPVITQPAFLVAGATVLGLVLAGFRSGEEGGLPDSNLEGGGRLAARSGLFAVSAALVIVGTWGIAQIRADRHVLKMAEAETRQDWPTVIREGLLARQLNPQRTDPRFATASAFLHLGRPAEAVQMLRELLNVAPYHANALGNLAIAHSRLGDTQEAISSLRRLLLLRPDDLIAQNLLAQLESQ